MTGEFLSDLIQLTHKNANNISFWSAGFCNQFLKTWLNPLTCYTDLLMVGFRTFFYVLACLDRFKPQLKVCSAYIIWAFWQLFLKSTLVNRRTTYKTDGCFVIEQNRKLWLDFLAWSLKQGLKSQIKLSCWLLIRSVVLAFTEMTLLEMITWISQLIKPDDFQFAKSHFSVPGNSAPLNFFQFSILFENSLNSCLKWSVRSSGTAMFRDCISTCFILLIKFSIFLVCFSEVCFNSFLWYFNDWSLHRNSNIWNTSEIKLFGWSSHDNLILFCFLEDVTKVFKHKDCILGPF